jgi:hypothetical protein
MRKDVLIFYRYYYFWAASNGYRLDVIDIKCVSGSGFSKGSIIINKITDGVN